MQNFKSIAHIVSVKKIHKNRLLFDPPKGPAPLTNSHSVRMYKVIETVKKENIISKELK